MATTDPKRAALVKALMERDLYAMLEVPRDADDAAVLAAIARRTEWVEETPMRHADREAEMHWLAWAERALVTDPEIRAEYDAALDRKAAAEARAVESRQRVRKLRQARDELAKREAGRAVLVDDKTKKAPAPRRTKDVAAPAGAGPEVAEVEVDVEVTEVVEVVETDAGTVFTDVTETVVAVATDEGIEVVDQVDVVEALVTPEGEVEVVEVVDTVTITGDSSGVEITEEIDVITPDPGEPAA